MVLFGIDVSHHQGALDFARFRQESGIEYAFIKATEGSTFVDSDFAGNLRQAQNAGMLVAAYHYQRSNASATAQIANIQRVVPDGIPVILDVEANSGDISLTRALVTGLSQVGVRVPLSYVPRWYWQQIGSPGLSGLPPLWSSRYPDNVQGGVLDEYADVPASYWTGYGGLDVAVLQFTSSGRLPGYNGPLDLNAFQGDRAQLAALLGGEVDMPLSSEDLNNVWMFPCTGTGPDGTTQTHPAIVWITAMAYRIATIEQSTAQLAGRDPVDINEAEVALNLAPMLVDALEPQLTTLSDADIARISTSVNNEMARRQAE
jgi:Glycosyl hydrolases family 25